MIQRSSTILFALGCFALCLIPFNSAVGYDFDGNNLSANNGRPRWASMPITYRYNQNVNGLLPNVVAGSNPRSAIDASFAEWASVANVSFTLGADTSVTDGGVNDGINLITFENTAGNVAKVGGALAVTMWYRNSSNQILDADIIYNPADTFTTLSGSSPTQYSIRSLTTHESGHFLGLEHSGVFGATMFPYLGANGVVTESENLPGTTTHDDRAAINQLYPIAPYNTKAGGIEGTIRLSGTKAYGVHVVAVRISDGIVYGANNTLGANQSIKNGIFEIQGLPYGDYYVFAEPMDYPLSSGNWTGNYAGGDMWGTTFTSGYQTTFYGGNLTPTTATVIPGFTTPVSFGVTAGTPTINVRYAGYSPDGLSFPNASGLPLNIQPGTTRWVVIIGDNISSVPDGSITCSDPTITIDTSARSDGTVSGIPYSIFQVTVPIGAPGGARNLQFQIGSEIAVFTGGLNVDAAETFPLPPNFARDSILFR